ncbi:hypothetical protein FH972_027268 [Carpinus fangiana]|uniref:TF-B3 domain-containing protein n=1 Tax=Carpinus fangiana TaxID=176857 RepID=A0A5N6L6G8_9ROSI|nr:hypothetical protein FH972_027268 [Carpinus fangiana]
MNLCIRGRANKVYLGKEWQQFAIQKDIREGDTVTFSELIWRHAGTMPRVLFKITHEAARREPIGQFDLNELPPPE